MFGIGPAEFILLFFIALIVLGPKKLPGIAKAIGRGVLQFKRAMNDTIEEDSGDAASGEDAPGGEPVEEQDSDPAEATDSPEESA